MCLFHLNISSLCFHREELTTLISEHDLAFGITGISKCQLKLDKDPLILFKYQGITLSSLPLNVIMEALHYTSKNLNYKLRSDIQIYKPKQLESKCLLITQDKEHTVVGCIYRNPSMEL